MKKYIIVYAILIISLLTGCKSKSNESNEKNEYANSLSKSQKIEIRIAENEEIYLIDEKKDIEGFIKKIKVDRWELKELPEDAEVAREYIFYQSETVKPSDETNNNDNIYEAARLITYKDIPYINFTMDDLEFSFLIAEETAQYLNTLGD